MWRAKKINHVAGNLLGFLSTLVLNAGEPLSSFLLPCWDFLQVARDWFIKASMPNLNKHKQLGSGQTYLLSQIKAFTFRYRNSFNTFIRLHPQSQIELLSSSHFLQPELLRGHLNYSRPCRKTWGNVKILDWCSCIASTTIVLLRLFFHWIIKVGKGF